MDRTNLFFLAVAAVFGFWIFTEYQKQKDDQDRLIAQRQIWTTSVGPRATDYAERLSQERDWTREAATWGG